MEECHVPGLVNPVSSGTNLWHLTGALYRADNLLLEHSPRCISAPLQHDFAITV